MNKVLGVWEYSIKNPEGFTLDLKTMKPITRGFCVAYQATQDCHSLESLEQVINHALEHHSIVGGWLDKRSELYYFDSVRVFHESQKVEALAFAIEQKQIAIYDLKKRREYYINQ